MGAVLTHTYLLSQRFWYSTGLSRDFGSKLTGNGLGVGKTVAFEALVTDAPVVTIRFVDIDAAIGVLVAKKKARTLPCQRGRGPRRRHRSDRCTTVKIRCGKSASSKRKRQQRISFSRFDIWEIGAIYCLSSSCFPRESL